MVVGLTLFFVWFVLLDKSEEVVEYLLDKSEEVVGYAKKQRWWNKIFGKNSGPVAEKYDVATQLAIGGVSGWWVDQSWMC